MKSMLCNVIYHSYQINHNMLVNNRDIRLTVTGTSTGLVIKVHMKIVDRRMYNID